MCRSVEPPRVGIDGFKPFIQARGRRDSERGRRPLDDAAIR